MRAHIDGVRVSREGVGYYMRYTGYLVGYNDERFGGGDIGHRGKDGDGLAMDIKLETA